MYKYEEMMTFYNNGEIITEIKDDIIIDGDQEEKIAHNKHLGLVHIPRRTKFTHPYSYDPFIIWKKEVSNSNPLDSVYSDRLYQWDSDKHDRLCHKHFGNKGQYWNSRDPKKIEAFLRDYYEDSLEDIELVMVIEYCNVSNGYPCWRFDLYYKEKEKKSDDSKLLSDG